MAPTRRRSLLATFGTAAVAGCLASPPTDSPDGSTTDATERVGADSEDAASSADTLRLAVTDGLPTDRSVRVHPRALADLLERGAEIGEAVRATDAIIQPGQPPLLPGERTVRLAGDGEEDVTRALCTAVTNASRPTPRSFRTRCGTSRA